MSKTSVLLELMVKNSKSAGEIIKLIRSSLNISQSTLGSKIGISQQAVALMEAGKRKVDFDTMVQILELFESVSPDYVDGVTDGLLTGLSFWEWLETGCNIKYNVCKLNGLDGMIFDVDGKGYTFFVPDDIMKTMPDILERYTKAMIITNATNK